MLIRCRFSDIQMVLLVVGQGKAKISVHENVLFEASPVFKAAFSYSFKESHDRAIHLPNDDPALMDLLVQSLYRPESRPDILDTPMQLSRLYVLADKYDIVKVKNKICEGFHLLLIHQQSLSARGLPYFLPEHLVVKLIYEHTTSTAPMRRLLADWFAWGVGSAFLDHEAHRRWLLSVPEFAVDICAVLAKNADRKAKACIFKSDKSIYLEVEPVRDGNQVN